MEARDLRKDPIAKVQVLMYEYASELAKRAGISDDLISNVCSIDYVKGVSWLKENLETIKERSNGQILLLRPDFTLDVDIEDYDEAIKAYMDLTGSETAVSEIKGQCASVGQVTGPVQVVLEVNSNTDFKEGSVLVTSMTRPEFVPFMKKAIAVVTNEGGITCHAAIVSRELKIPCVIGTKLATKILKTGDMVEVDADKGVVKIIS